MLYVDNHNDIELTRGDTGLFTIELKSTDGEDYEPQEGSSLRFAVAKKYGATESECDLIKEIPIDTMTLEITAEESKALPFGNYLYDIQFTDPFGRVSTVIMAKLKITKEVY